MCSRIFLASFSENAIKRIKAGKIGIELNGACISEDLDDERRPKLVRSMREEIKQSAANGAILHGPFTEIYPQAIDHRAVELGFERIEQAYQVCEQLGVERMVVHSGHMPLLYFNEWHIEKSVRFWRRFMEGKPENFRLYIENVFEPEPYVMKDLVEAIDDCRVQLCLDIGHANALMDHQKLKVSDWIQVLGEHIGHFHFHNNDGRRDRHDPLEEGTIDMEQTIASIKRFCRSDITITVESRRDGGCIEFLKKRL